MKKRGITYTQYVDDITLSAKHGITYKEGKRVFIDEQAYLRLRNRNSENK